MQKILSVYVLVLLIIGIIFVNTMDEELFQEDVAEISEQDRKEVDKNGAEDTSGVVPSSTELIVENSDSTSSQSENSGGRQIEISDRKIAVGAFADFGPYEDDITIEKIVAFESLIGTDIAWAYFSDNWIGGITFPDEKVRMLLRHGIIPYIRMMPREDFRRRPDGSLYVLKNIMSGDFDSELRLWARDARDVKLPLIIEFGTEVNGDWFPWNGRWNGGGDTDVYGNSNLADGPEIFRDTYRHIINLFREEGAHNVIWVYHVNAESTPKTSWNTFDAYYPGDEYIDWIGVSVYGAQYSGDPWRSFTAAFDPVYKALVTMSKRPIAIVETGVREGSIDSAKASWVTEMFSALASDRYDRVNGLAFWHSSWRTDEGEVVNLRIDSSQSALSAYVAELAAPHFVSEITSPQE